MELNPPLDRRSTGMVRDRLPEPAHHILTYLRPPSSYNPKNPGSDADANSLNLKRVKGLAQRRSLAFEEGVFTGEEEDELVEALCSRCI